MRDLPSIRKKLFLLVLACIIPTVFGFAVLFKHFYQKERMQFEQNTLNNAHALVLGVDRDLSSIKTAALVLSASPYLEQNDLASFHAYAKKFITADFPGFAFSLSDAKGQQILNTLRPFGEALPMHSNPSQVHRVFETEKPVVSDLFMGESTQRPSLSIDVPVWLHGRVAYSLAVEIYPERLADVLVEQLLPENYIVGIFDTKGIVVARSREQEKYIGKYGAMLPAQRLLEKNEGQLETTTFEGIPVYSFFSRSAVSGWTVAIGIPKKTVQLELFKSLSWIAVIVISLSCIGLIFAWRIGGSIRRSVIALASPNQLAEQLQTAPMSFVEADDVAKELLRQRYLVEERGLQLSRDITERKIVEEKLHLANALLVEDERFLRAVIDSLPGLMAYWDKDLRCRFSNKQYLEWFGKTSEQMIGIHIHELLGEKVFSLNEPYLRKALQGEMQQFERILTKPSGERVHAWTHYTPLVDAQGKVTGILAMVTDVTILKLAEIEQRIAAVAFESSEAMLITNADTVILRVNKAFSELTGYAPDEILGKTPRILQSGRHDSAFFTALWKSIITTGSWRGEIWDRTKDGKHYLALSTITAVIDESGITTHYVGTQTDITARKAAEEEIRKLAFYDVLTGLPNRRLLIDRLRHTLSSCARTGKGGALMFIDLDNFKTINDTLGHDKGDLLLQQVALRLSDCVREGDTVARLGGDEFMVMLDNLSESPEEACLQVEVVGEKILTALNQPYALGDLQHRNTSSIGVTVFSNHQASIAELLKRADIAMYQAKAAGRNALRFFDEKIQAIVTMHAALEKDLRQGLEKNEFVLHYQAQVNQYGQLTGVEALVRWQHPHRGLMQPKEFIHLAEDSGLIQPMGSWVLETACAQLAMWNKRAAYAHLTMSVNVSALQFRSPEYVDFVLDVLKKTGAQPRKLKLEITESMLLEDVDDIIIKMTALQSHGISFSLDDFGTGYSSLLYLKQLPIDQLKIDQSFVIDMLTDHNDATIASAIVALGQNLELGVIAEGVETEEQRQFLADHNCKAYQGFLFARPLPLLEFEAWVQHKLETSP